MNAPRLTIPALIVAGFAAGILVGYLIRIKGPPCIDQPPPATFVVSYDNYAPPSLKAFYDAVAVGPGTNAIFKRDMILVDNNGCSVPTQFVNVGGSWCPGTNPCIQPNMGQQVTQRVGFHNLDALQKALGAMSSSPAAPSP